MSDNTIIIDRYLHLEMDADERAFFERQLQNDPALREELAAQQQIMYAVTTTGLKETFASALNKTIQTRRFIKWGIILGIGIAAFLLYAVKNNWLRKHVAVTQATGLEGGIAFSISNDSDTIIETPDGVVFAIPAHAFETDNNIIQLDIKTALDGDAIIRRGLSTMSGEDLLRTAGMFYINGFANGKALALVRAITVSLPTEDIDPAMQLFDGVADSSGRINWVNPRPVDKRLRTYETSSLDFYPPGYIATLQSLGKNYQNKIYTDSLYYSFSNYGRYPAAADEMPEANPTTKPGYFKDSGNTFQRHPSDSGAVPSYEIDPSRIKAIWNTKFNNTIIATKEFEERLGFLHGLCNAVYLDTYLKNLGKPLHECDLLCANKSTGATRKKFLEFAARGDGAVIIADGLQAKLTRYFSQKFAAYKAAAAKTWAGYQQALAKLDSIANTKEKAAAIAALNRNKKNFDEEFCANLTEAYQQVGIRRSCTDSATRPISKYYTVSINTTGWKNLDAYVMDATQSRQSMTYTDPLTGKTSKLTYSEVSISVENRQAYDRVFVYLLPDGLSSFQRVAQQGSFFKEQLNALFRYDAVVLAFKGTQAWYYKQTGMQAKAYKVQLNPITDRELQIALNAYDINKSKDIKTEFEFQLFEQREALRQLAVSQEAGFREQVAAVIFKCFSLK